MCIAQFAKASSLKKIRPIILIVWVIGRVEKTPKKRVRKIKLKKISFVLNKYETVTHISIFQALFRSIVFRYVAFVTKKVMSFFRFFFQRSDFFPR